VNIELKSYETADKVVDLIEILLDKYWNYNQFIVSSFDWNALQQVAFLNSAIRIGVLTEENLDHKFIQASSIHPDYHLLTAENTAKLQEKGFQVFPDSERTRRHKKIKSFNVNGIISDFPDRI
jgi:glycerophosphoryl diester phosphodiesterase